MNNFFTYEKPTKPTKPTWTPQTRKILTKDLILEAQENTKSNMEAARWIGVSFNTYKKWAKHYGVFEQHLNQAGVGIKKGFGVWAAKNGTKSKKAAGYEKRWNEDGTPNYGSSVYILGLEGEKLEYFRKTWKKEYYKVGKANDIPKRVRDLLGGRKDLGIPWEDDDMWKYWGKHAKVLKCIPTRTSAEALDIETAFHYRLKETQVKGILSVEMFETSIEKINELIKIEVIDYKSQFLQRKIDVSRLMLEWSRLVPDGIPDVKNEQHLDCLMKVLNEKYDLSEELMDLIYENITS